MDVDSDDCMALNPTNPAARKMVSTILHECAALEGATSPWLHLGGDEVKYVVDAYERDDEHGRQCLEKYTLYVLLVSLLVLVHTSESTKGRRRI